MAKKKAKFEAWECDCGAMVAMGSKCPVCHKSYIDIKLENDNDKKKPTKKGRKYKYREPAWEGEFIKSYCFKKK